MKLSDGDFMRLAGFIKAKYGLDLYEKKFLVESRLTNYVLDSGYSNFSEYLDAVYRDRTGNEMANVINRLTTNYTYFMREKEHFRHFSEVFLSGAVRRRGGRELSIWSAGCSFGNEPYNFAMCADEFFGGSKYLWDTRILATDISFKALRSAKNGIYLEESLKALPGAWIDKYFIRLANGTYQVRDGLRRDVIFRYHNLMDEINFKRKFDLIICRNVMIYFDEPTRARLINRFYDATNDGGYLYIGHSEICAEKELYAMEEPAVYRKLSAGEGKENGG
ncbi:protein-glutamate O-methyltransferase CheR [Ruminococcus sp. Marseille-P6503]|uniref:CheR family methyltransferase n=1 Tax=Ruminococcus sp. Marseille-P6503 TaxID=2364796 RepID=UPI000F5201C5|nr:protein-glutamate O-methyltransferase CheR [Ruminococcus sp. Marseille-P6503]